jgi:hypothetical protein
MRYFPCLCEWWTQSAILFYISRHWKKRVAVVTRLLVQSLQHSLIIHSRYCNASPNCQFSTPKNRMLTFLLSSGSIDRPDHLKRMSHHCVHQRCYVVAFWYLDVKSPIMAQEISSWVTYEKFTSTQKTETIRSCETMVRTYDTAWLQNPEGNHRYLHRRENLIFQKWEISCIFPSQYVSAVRASKIINA